MSVPKISRQSRTTEVDATIKLIIQAYKETQLQSDPYLPALFGTISTISLDLTKAINRSKRESILDDKDSIRDDALRAPFYLVQGYRHHPDATIESAATTVTTVLDKYGIGIATESYAIESSLIESLLQDLSEGEIPTEIEKLPGLADLITKLTAAQAEFEAERLSYEQDKAQETTTKSATAVKRLMLEELNGKLVIYLRAMAQVDETTYGSFVRTLSEIIGNNNSSVKKRQAN